MCYDLLADRPEGQMRFFRWFYSQTLNKDRFDGYQRYRSTSRIFVLTFCSPVMWQNEMYFSEVIFDHVADQQYDVFMQPDELVCFMHSINGTIPKPNLANMQYIGKALVNYDPVYHWFQQDTASNTTFQVPYSPSPHHSLVHSADLSIIVSLAHFIALVLRPPGQPRARPHRLCYGHADLRHLALLGVRRHPSGCLALLARVCHPRSVQPHRRRPQQLSVLMPSIAWLAAARDNAKKKTLLRCIPEALATTTIQSDCITLRADPKLLLLRSRMR